MFLNYTKEGKYGKLGNGEYDVYLGERKVAEIRTTFTMKEMRVVFDNNEGYKKIALSYLTVDEALEMASRIIKKSLYKEANEIFEALKEPAKIVD